MSVTANWQRSDQIVIFTFTDHLGQQYSETGQMVSVSDAELNAISAARATAMEIRLAEVEADKLLGGEQ